MKAPIYVIAIAVVVGFGAWVYDVNYRTQAALDRVSDLNRAISDTREELSVLRVEWAYLNRPERLERLVAMHFDRLGLMPLDPGHFGEVTMVSYPVQDMVITQTPVALREMRLPMTLEEAMILGAQQ